MKPELETSEIFNKDESYVEINSKEELVNYIRASMVTALSDIYKTNENKNIRLNKLMIKEIKKSHFNSVSSINLNLIKEKFFCTSSYNWTDDYRSQNQMDKNKVLSLSNRFCVQLINDLLKVKTTEAEVVKDFLILSKNLCSYYYIFDGDMNGYSTKTYFDTAKMCRDKLIAQMDIVKFNNLVKKSIGLISDAKILYIYEMIDLMNSHKDLRHMYDLFLRGSINAQKYLKRLYLKDQILNNEDEKPAKSLRDIISVFRESFNDKDEIKNTSNIIEEMVSLHTDTMNNILNVMVLDKGNNIDYESLSNFDKLFLMDNDKIKKLSKDEFLEQRNVLRELLIINLAYSREKRYREEETYSLNGEDIKEFKILNFKEKRLSGDKIAIYAEITEALFSFELHKRCNCDSDGDIERGSRALMEELKLLEKNKSLLAKEGFITNVYSNKEIYKNSNFKFLGQDTAVVEVICKEKDADLYQDLIENFVAKKIEAIFVKKSAVGIGRGYRRLWRNINNVNNTTDSDKKEVIDIDIMEILENLRKRNLDDKLLMRELELKNDDISKRKKKI